MSSDLFPFRAPVYSRSAQLGGGLPAIVISTTMIGAFVQFMSHEHRISFFSILSYLRVRSSSV